MKIDKEYEAELKKFQEQWKKELERVAKEPRDEKPLGILFYYDFDSFFTSEDAKESRGESKVK